MGPHGAAQPPLRGCVAHPRPDRSHRHLVARDLPALDQQPSDRNIGQPVLAVVAEPDRPAVFQPNPSRALDLQEEGVDRIIDPEKFEAAAGKRAIFDLGAEEARAGAEVGRAAESGGGSAPPAQRAAQLGLEVAGEGPGYRRNRRPPSA